MISIYIYNGLNLKIITIRPDLMNNFSFEDDLGFKITSDIINVINEIDGLTNLDNVVKNICDKYDENYDDILNSLINMINTYPWLNLSGEPKKFKPEILGDGNTQYPMKIIIELTDFCNYYCKHCYNDSNNKNNTFIDSNKLIKVFEGLRNKGVTFIELMGGEPLTHPDIDKIVDFFCNEFDMVSIVSNGSLLGKHVETFKNYSNLMLQLTLNSIEPKYHDWFCGVDGQFNIVKNNIKKACDAGLHVTVSLNITNKNVNKFEEVANLAHDLGAKAFKTGTVLKTGRATDDLIYKDDKDIIRRINILADKFEENFIDRQSENVHDDNVNRTNCGIATTQLTISPKGDIALCEIPVEQINLGNIFNDNVDNLMSSISYCNYQNFQEPNHTYCGDCEFVYVCRYCTCIGLQQYFKLGDKCKWGSSEEVQKYIKQLI